MTEITSQLTKMESAIKTLEHSETRFMGLLKNFINNKEVETNDVMATFRRLTKAKTTYENRLTKKRMELEILAKEFKEVEMLLDQRCLEAITKEEDAKKLAAQQQLEIYSKSIPNYAKLPPEEQAFRRFCVDRVRHRTAGYPCVTGELVSLKEIHKCYKQWADCKGEKRVMMTELEGFCEKYYGDSKGKKIYSHLRVFLEDEDVEEFEKENPTIFEEAGSDSDD